MKIYLNKTVVESAYQRITALFQEFPEVIVSISGGKDSSVLFHIAFNIADRLNRLPLKVLFIDQEAEWQATIDVIEQIMMKDGIVPLWHQMPIKILNATSSIEQWQYCWNPELKEKWLRGKHPIAIKENSYGTDRFGELFHRIPEKLFPDTKMCLLSGMTTDESPERFMALTYHETYNGRTWGKILNKKRQHFTFYPLYDWSYTDVWKYIFDHNIQYNVIYDKYLIDGIPFRKMRISNLHHEKAVHQLFYVQRYEPQTYEKLIQRIPGADMAGKFGNDDYFLYNLPSVFSSWKEYRDYLVESPICPQNHREKFKRRFQKNDDFFKYLTSDAKEEWHQIETQSIITNDIEFTKMESYLRMPSMACYRQYIRGKYTWTSIPEKYHDKIDRDQFLEDYPERQVNEKSS